MEIEKSKVLIQFLPIFRQSVDVLFFLYARRLRGYTATLDILVINLVASTCNRICFCACGQRNDLIPLECSEMLFCIRQSLST